MSDHRYCVTRSEVKEIVDQKISWNNLMGSWGDLYDKMQLRDKIETEVSRQIGSIDFKVESSVNRQLPSLNSRYLQDHLPGMVKPLTKDAIDIYMPKYIEGSQKMKEAMEKHLRDVETKVETKTYEVVDRIVQEDKYATVLDAFKSDLKLSNERNLNSLQKTNEEILNRLKLELKASKNEFTQKSSQIDFLHQENSRLRQELNKTNNITTGAFFVGIIGLGTGLFSIFHK